MSDAAISEGDVGGGSEVIPAAAGGLTGSWRDGLEAGVKDHPALADVPDVPTLAKNYLATKEMVGKKGLILPREDDPADVARFRAEIGVPETPEGYDLTGFAPPEGLPWSDDFQTAMLSRLHRVGIPNGQIRKVLDEYAEESNDQYHAMLEQGEQGHTTAQEALRTELGKNYDSDTALAKRAFKAAAGKNEAELSQLRLSDGTNLGDHPAFVRTFIQVGRQFSEHGLAGEKVGGGGFLKTPQQAQDEIAQIESHPALWNADHPEHKQIQARKNELYEQAYPEYTPEVL